MHLSRPVRGLIASAVATTCLVAGALATTSSAATGAYLGRASASGYDVSWPQCPKGVGIPQRKGLGLPMPPSGASFVVLGLTNGPGWTPNPCLASQVTWAKRHHVWTAAYSMTTFPTPAQQRAYRTSGPWKGGDAISHLRNAGYAQARSNVATLRRAGLSVPHVWVDVEPYSLGPWTRSVPANKAVVDGVLRGYRDAGLSVGFYSVPSLWTQILGGTRYRLPEWRTAGPRSAAAALARCGAGQSFQGGKEVLAQWWTDTADHDLLCPRMSTVTKMRRYFTKY